MHVCCGTCPLTRPTSSSTLNAAGPTSNGAAARDAAGDTTTTRFGPDSWSPSASPQCRRGSGERLLRKSSLPSPRPGGGRSTPGRGDADQYFAVAPRSGGRAGRGRPLRVRGGHLCQGQYRAISQQGLWLPARGKIKIKHLYQSTVSNSFYGLSLWQALHKSSEREFSQNPFFTCASCGKGPIMAMTSHLKHCQYAIANMRMSFTGTMGFAIVPAEIAIDVHLLPASVSATIGRVMRAMGILIFDRPLDEEDRGELHLPEAIFGGKKLNF